MVGRGEQDRAGGDRSEGEDSQQAQKPGWHGFL
jgi:hypothetical protein